MSIQAVREYLKAYGRDGDILELRESSATVELAAQALGVQGARIAKTLSFGFGDGCILLVAAGDAKVQNGAFKRQFGLKPSMLSAEAVEALTGHAPGGVCPFAVQDRPGVQVYLDVSLQRFDTVFPACGSSNSAIELSCDELEQLSHSLGWVDVCRGWREDEAPAG